jgi:hypothetical protein
MTKYYILRKEGFTDLEIRLINGVYEMMRYKDNYGEKHCAKLNLDKTVIEKDIQTYGTEITLS